MILLSAKGPHPMNISIREFAQNLLTALDSPRRSGLDSALDSLPTVGATGAQDTHREEQFDILLAIAEDLRFSARAPAGTNTSSGRQAAITDILRQLSVDSRV